jgi:hypothetical protein
MSIELCFWILMLLWLLFSVAWNWPGSSIGPYGPLGNSLLIFILFLLLGWKVFGAPLHG